MAGFMCGRVQGPFSPLSGLCGKIGIEELRRLALSPSICVLHYENREGALKHPPPPVPSEVREAKRGADSTKVMQQGHASSSSS